MHSGLLKYATCGRATYGQFDFPGAPGHSTLTTSFWNSRVDGWLLQTWRAGDAISSLGMEMRFGGSLIFARTSLNESRTARCSTAKSAAWMNTAAPYSMI